MNYEETVQDNFIEKLLKEIEEEQNREIKVRVEKNFFFYEWINKFAPPHSRWRLLLFLPNFFELIKIASKIKEENGKEREA
ncbi:MAG: hypothetical protein QXQ82_02005 [Candidatus Pacearchaeota archaeon]